MVNRNVLIALVSFVALWWAVAAEAWTGRVISVHDGDTYKVQRDDTGETETVRLFGIDTPEIQINAFGRKWDTQPYARRATKFVQGLFAKYPRVTVLEVGESYGRAVSHIIRLSDGVIVQEEIARAGLGWVDPRFCRKSIPVCRLWMELQQEAAEQRRGLWRDLDTKRPPVAPWLWRKGARGE